MSATLSMEHLLVDPVTPDESVIRRAASVILAGGVVAYPTDTLYGLAVDPRNAQAVERLFAAKQRTPDQAIPLIAADLLQVEREVGRLTDLARRLASRFWPGPLTLVIAASPGISPSIHGGSGSVAVRVPDHGVARMLAADCGCAITSTSANLSGQRAPRTADEIVQPLRDRIDALLDAGAAPGGPPSTIVDVTGSAPALVREGVVPWARVLECV
jgi:L-threonylcarbamoyladenylate synthase